MSISDQIVVMREGVVQQTGEPQNVYDDPVNLFVAQFLGTPPINIFHGSIRGGKVYIGDRAVMDANCADVEAVTVAVRPEGFIPAQQGVLTCEKKRVEVMGRDISVVCGHEAFAGENFRAIVDGEDLPKLTGEQVRFDLKPNKVFAFREDTGERIRLQ